MTSQPHHEPQTDERRDQLAALNERLESARSPGFPSDPDTEKTIRWIASSIDKGLCRVYAVNINKCLDEVGCKRLVERVRRRIDDPQLIEQLKKILTTSPQPEIIPFLADIALESIDQILQQAKALGREENFFHLQCTRVGNELIVLADGDPRYEWILAAVQKRLREELSELKYNVDYAKTQLVDLAQGHKLHFLDFELCAVRDRDGNIQVQYKRLAQPVRRQRQRVSLRLNLRQRCLGALSTSIALLRRAPALLPALSKRRLGVAAAVLGVVVVAAVWWLQPPKPTTGFLDCVYTDPEDDEEYKYVLYVPPTYNKRNRPAGLE